MSSDLALRLRACERVRHAIDTLAQLGPVSQIVERCATEGAEAADLDRLVLSRIDDGTLVVERVHARDGNARALLDALAASPLRLAYPLLECELLRRRQARLVDDIDHAQPARYAFLDALGWESYVAAPIAIDRRVVGFLHGDRAPGRRALSELDVDALRQFAGGFAMVFERAVLRRRLREQGEAIRRIAAWAEARTAALSDSVIDLSVGAAGDGESAKARAPVPASLVEDPLGAQLTVREVDVLRLLAEGKTNGEIARTLFVSEGTVKFHVKNILRKMQASNRSDAGARYLRMTLGDRSAPTSPTLR